MEPIKAKYKYETDGEVLAMLFENNYESIAACLDFAGIPNRANTEPEKFKMWCDTLSNGIRVGVDDVQYGEYIVCHTSNDQYMSYSARTFDILFTLHEEV